MKLKKRILIIMFAAFVALAGCGRGDKNNSKEPAATVTLSFPADTYFTGCDFEKNEIYYREGVDETGAPDLIMFYYESKD
jgi:hypothetical protein